MTSPLATYTFLPWLRQGLGTKVSGASGSRATIKIELELVSDRIDGGAPVEPVERTVALYGPGDIVGVERRAIVRTEPLAWITNFEPNYLPFIEFYDEDFPWRYSPTAPFHSERRLTPWVALAVLREGEFKDVAPGRAPLAAIDVADPSVFPPPGELWAWAHVHASRDIKDGAAVVDGDAAGVAEALRAAVASNPDEACSRLLSPRQLSPNEAYHAFLIPTFESGRLAGLGLDPAKTPRADQCAWDAANHPERSSLAPTLYPYYHRWYFRTGSSGDFEYLVRQLKPRAVDARVGVRDVDVQRPGINVAGIAKPPTLKFSGALRAPRSSLDAEELAEAEAQDAWADPFPHPFQRTLADLVNLSDSYEETPADVANGAYADGARAAESQSSGDVPAPPALALIDNDPDPIITPPIYGCWHARATRLLTARDGSAVPHQGNWLHELNLDPRWRSAAGLGTQVVQSQQETWMASAWAQVGALADANRMIRGGQFAMVVSRAWHSRTVAALVRADPARSLMLTAPLHAHVLQDGKSIRARASASSTPPSLLSTAMRRAMRPRARLANKLGFTVADPPHRALARIDAGEIPAVPPKKAPEAVPKVDDTIAVLGRRPWPALAGWLADWLFGTPLWLLLAWLIVSLLALSVLGAAGLLVSIVVAGAAIVLRRMARERNVIEDIKEERRTPESVERMPASSDFVLLQEFGSRVSAATRGTYDSAEAARFKEALRRAYASERQADSEAPVASDLSLGLAGTARHVLGSIDPRTAVRHRTMHGLRLPKRLEPSEPEAFDQIMNHPVFELPMYQPLKELSAEHLLPNLHLIPADSITLLETNQKFIESYMLGLNHEFARELLWREYPTDQRGSYFRQFWDVSAYYDPAVTDLDALKEKLRDIPRIHLWGPESSLGTHDNREEPGAAQEEELVLVIRGELLKKYPNAVIYAHRAEWPMRNGRIDRTKERSLAPLDAAEQLAPPRTKVKTPLYQAKASDDVFLFGFDLTVDVARGGSGDDPGDEARPGWFFVIKERPGEPRFGLDDGSGSSPPEIWADLSWSHVAAGAHLALSPPVTLVEPTDTSQAEFAARHDQWGDDRQVAWGPDVDAAEVAYVLYQSPILVAVHAAEMLPKKAGADT